MPVGLLECIPPINTLFDGERFAIPMFAWTGFPPGILDKGCKLCTRHRILADGKGVSDRYDFLWIFIATSAGFAHGTADCEISGRQHHHFGTVSVAVTKRLPNGEIAGG